MRVWEDTKISVVVIEKVSVYGCHIRFFNQIREQFYILAVGDLTAAIHSHQIVLRCNEHLVVRIKPESVNWVSTVEHLLLKIQPDHFVFFSWHILVFQVIIHLNEVDFAGLGYLVIPNWLSCLNIIYESLYVRQSALDNLTQGSLD